MAIGSDRMPICSSFVRKICVAAGWNHASMFTIAPQRWDHGRHPQSHQSIRIDWRDRTTTNPMSGPAWPNQVLRNTS